MRTPAADVVIDERLVRSLLMAQCPGLADRPLQRVATGWDNEIWRLGDDLAVRLPRHREAVALLRTEQRWLARLAAGLPLPVPVPRHLGLPTDRFGWPWSVVPWIEGSPGDRTPPGRPLDTAVALGGFLRALHRPAPEDAPRNRWRGVPLRARQDALDRRIARIARSADDAAAVAGAAVPGPAVPDDAAAGAPVAHYAAAGAAVPDGVVPALRRRWAEAVDAPAWRDAPSWVHGDLHPANTVVRGGTLAGVLDFGDLCAGDPATDLAAAWLLLPVDAHDAFWQAYGRDDGPLRRRAAGWATLFALMLHGSVGGPDAVQVAVTAMGRLAGGKEPAPAPRP